MSLHPRRVPNKGALAVGRACASSIASTYSDTTYLQLPPSKNTIALQSQHLWVQPKLCSRCQFHTFKLQPICRALQTKLCSRCQPHHSSNTSADSTSNVNPHAGCQSSRRTDNTIGRASGFPCFQLWVRVSVQRRVTRGLHDAQFHHCGSSTILLTLFTRREASHAYPPTRTHSHHHYGRRCHTCHLHVANGGSRGLPWSSILGTLFEAKTSKKNPLNIIKTKKKIVNTRLKSVLTVRSHISRHTSWNHISRISITPCKKTRVVFLFFVHLMFRGNSLLVWSSHPIHIFNSHRP